MSYENVDKKSLWQNTILSRREIQNQAAALTIVLDEGDDQLHTPAVICLRIESVQSVLGQSTLFICQDLPVIMYQKSASNQWITTVLKILLKLCVPTSRYSGACSYCTYSCQEWWWVWCITVWFPSGFHQPRVNHM